MDTNFNFAAAGRYGSWFLVLLVTAVVAPVAWAQPQPANPSETAVGRQFSRKSCADIAAVIAKAVGPAKPGPSPVSATDLDCGAAMNLPAQARLEWQKAFWDLRLEAWVFSLRCQRASECIPFLVRTRRDRAARLNDFLDERLGRERAFGRPPAFRNTGDNLPPDIAIRPGQSAELVWEQSGIRIAVPVTSLGSGRIGDAVRVRTHEAGGAILRAQVLASGQLKWFSAGEGRER